jgi:hypothetical protein
MENFLSLKDDFEKPKNPLSAKIWASIYKDTSPLSQITMIKEIMINLGVSFIKAGDMIRDQETGIREFQWMIRDKQETGSMSSCMLNALGYMHSYKIFNERCSQMVKTFRDTATICVDDNIGVLRKASFKNNQSAQENLSMILCTSGTASSILVELQTPFPNICHTRVLPSAFSPIKSQTVFFFHEILENDELYEKFIEVWKPDEELLDLTDEARIAQVLIPGTNETVPDYLNRMEVEEQQRRLQMTETERKMVERNDIIEERTNNIEQLTDILGDTSFEMFQYELLILIMKYKRNENDTDEDINEK